MSADDRIIWYRSPIPIEKLRELSLREMLRPLLHAGGHLLLNVATGVAVYLAYVHLAWPWVILSLWVHGTFRRFAGAVTGHELSHRGIIPGAQSSFAPR